MSSWNKNDGLTDSDYLYIRDAEIDDLREELASAAADDTPYRSAIAAEILRRQKATA